MSILFVTHNLGVVAEIAHEVAVMYAGRVVEQAPVEALFAHPEASLHAGAAAPAFPMPRATRTPMAGACALNPIPGTVPTYHGTAARLQFRAALLLWRSTAARGAVRLDDGRSAHLSRCWRHEVL